MDIWPIDEERRKRVHDRVRIERRRLVLDGPRWTRDYEGDFQRVTLPERDCNLLRDLVVAEGVETIVEIGLAYGSSALAIGEALVSVPRKRPLHVIIDPLQETTWSNVGWELIRSSGLDATSRLVLQPSSQALAGLVEQGFTADAAFVDGSHRFHEVFTDLYFLRKIVRPGGIVVLDDYWWPSVRTAIHYFESNMGWLVMPDVFDGGTTDPATGAGRLRALRLPDPSFEPSFDDFRPF
ncbi:class I SAM-dependent methyltransferase [Pseudonocardia sp. DSM 110487]|uniref:class I SAM-dependent methyltransferase n=1 Tax=Pseudonocardia sp. DSM 110487 TaxID=2865833 RepID=UPI001C6A4FA0|nr:class I SAM-dependent methyltransferase [Pseudonocardia sp. DSM 110487]QYN31963.1 class I SAM-dependent methyltransferase [Pseudonocardia sp. DSM 110487]